MSHEIIRSGKGSAMFRPGKVLKVKVELSPDVVGFGRATVVESQGTRLFLQLRTSKGEKRSLPKGTRVWFISDVPGNPFNGLWSTTIVSSRLIDGKTALECTRPKFEAHLQRRKFKRVSINYPVRVHGEKYDGLKAATRNVSRAGVGIEIYEDCVERFPSGHWVDITLDSPVGPVSATVRVVTARFNWLANKTDVGLEFVDADEATASAVDKLLQAVAGDVLSAPSGKEAGTQTGQLSTWLKTTRDNVSFVKGTGTHSLTEDDLDELEDTADDTNDEHESV